MAMSYKHSSLASLCLPGKHSHRSYSEGLTLGDGTQQSQLTVLIKILYSVFMFAIHNFRKQKILVPIEDRCFLKACQWWLSGKLLRQTGCALCMGGMAYSLSFVNHRNSIPIQGICMVFLLQFFPAHLLF